MSASVIDLMKGVGMDKADSAVETDEEQSSFDAALDLIEGVMAVQELLVASLLRSGRLDGDDYAQLLLDFRRDLVEPDSFREVVVDRMLGMLAGEDPAPLLRRRAFRLVTVGEGESEPTVPIQPRDGLNIPER